MLKRVKDYMYIFFRICWDSLFTRNYDKNVSQKPALFKFKDYCYWFLKNREFNSNYYLFGANNRGVRISEFIGKDELFKIKEKVELTLKTRAGCNKINYDVITKDKFCATSFFESNNVRCVPNIALISNSFLIFKDGRQVEVERIYDCISFPVIIKNTILEYNEGFNKCEIIKGQFHVNGHPTEQTYFIKKLKMGKWVIQEVQQSHSAIQLFNKSALNTTRIVTILRKGSPVYLTGFQSFATKDQITDSWGKGAIYVGIDPNKNRLKKYGYYHPGLFPAERVISHSDNGLNFEDYHIPGLQNAVDLCIRAHRLLYFHFLIGWDIAILENGPVILEANERPGMNAVQCVDGGLRDRILNYAKDILSNDEF